MKEELLGFISENGLSPFNKQKTQLNLSRSSIYKTSDAKKVHIKTLQKISQNFVFPDTSNLFSFFSFTDSADEILRRQDFFSKIRSFGKLDNSFLDNLRTPKNWWKPQYNVVVVTEDADTYDRLKKMNCPVQLLVSEQDVVLLESHEIVQVIDCPEYAIALESLPQAIFLRSIEEAYLERFLESFSGWSENIKIIDSVNSLKSLKDISSELIGLISLIDDSEIDKIDKDFVEMKVIEANNIIEEKLKEKTLSGINLINILSKGVLPQEIKDVIDESISEVGLPRKVLEVGIPLKVDEEELENMISEQEKSGFSDLAEKVKDNASVLKTIPYKLKELSNLLLFFDFLSGISMFMKEEYKFPKISEGMMIENSKNIFLSRPQPISFNLLGDVKCSILTGANSGGKTTLVEHILQLITLYQLGLSVSGDISLPLFEEVYYFAKNKGSNLKGAFETLLSQMSKIRPGNKTLILADEIEAVTEPGVAGNIIAATAKYYIDKDCYLVIATHLGYEIQKILPEKCRIDGIEATGLTENFDLIVNHNPVLGRLANSTPELIVEKMAKKEQLDYFIFLSDFLKR